MSREGVRNSRLLGYLAVCYLGQQLTSLPCRAGSNFLSCKYTAVQKNYSFKEFTFQFVLYDKKSDEDKLKVTIDSINSDWQFFKGKF